MATWRMFIVIRKLSYFAALALVASGFAAMAQGPPRGNYDESKVGTFTLPDPLTFSDRAN